MQHIIVKVININSVKSLREEIESLPKDFKINREEIIKLYLGLIPFFGGLTGIILTPIDDKNLIKGWVIYGSIAFTGASIINYEKDCFIKEKFQNEYQPKVVILREENSIYEIKIKPTLEISDDRLHNKINYSFEEIQDVTNQFQIIEVENFS